MGDAIPAKNNLQFVIQFTVTEGFGDIIISSAFISLKAFGILTSGCQKYKGALGLQLFQCAGHFKSIFVGKHQINDGHLIMLMGHTLYRLVGPMKCMHLVLTSLQIFAK